MKSSIVFLWVLICWTSSTNSLPFQSDSKDAKCGYNSCHPVKSGYINVHIVPHTHDDVGWLKTVDQYYYGSKSTIQKAGVQYILDSVVHSLDKHPERRFIYVETAFFWKWWIKQHDTMKSKVRRLINNGQLEIIGGAWSMNDEAVTHYQSIIDQFTWGLRKLNDTFGACGRPKVGWQIDPFGHSREMASIFAQLGYDGLLLGRIDYQDKKLRFETKTPEMIWQGSSSLGNKSQLFTTVMYNTYSPPPGFCFDILCDDDPIIDDKKSPDYNVDKKVQQFLAYVRNQVRAYATDNLIITMGGDFTYMQADVWYINLDKLIRYTNKLQENGSKLNLIYSTPSCYLKAVKEEGEALKVKWPVKMDDFFPYASDPHSFWTGYFTSKPTIKRFERMGNNFLQVCKQLYAMTDLGPEDWADLNVLREAMGVMQHHDAITGTEKDHVAHDYARQLTHGFDECHFTSATALSNIVTGHLQKQLRNIKEDPAPEINFVSCHLMNISQCQMTETSKSFIVTVYNPLSRPVNQYVRLPVTGNSYSIVDPDGNSVTADLIPIMEEILSIPGRNSSAKNELLFLAYNLPPLGFKSYYVALEKGSRVLQAKMNVDLASDNISVRLDQKTGLVKEVEMNGKKIPLKQEFLYYMGVVGDNGAPENRSSGAYIFRPLNRPAQPVTAKVTNKIFQGQVTSEIHQTFTTGVSQIIKLFAYESYIEFDWLVGPIPTAIDKKNNMSYGLEYISRFTTQLQNNGTFYTDSNGREMLKRVRNFRPTWKLDLQENVSGNYYPVTSRISIKDSNLDTEVSVLTDRAQGGSSLRDGEVELMVHRKCIHDDGFGVDETLEETAFEKGLVVRGQHYLMVGPLEKSVNGKSFAATQKDVQQRKILQAWTFLSPTDNLPYNAYKSKHRMQYSGLQRALPDNVQILTLEPWIGMNFLLRLEHVLEINDDPNLSKPVSVDLKKLFTLFEILTIRETTLGANQWLKDNVRPVYKTGETLENILLALENRKKNSSTYQRDEIWELGLERWTNNNTENDVDNLFNSGNVSYDFVDSKDFVITLAPMQIRTFVIDVKMNF